MRRVLKYGAVFTLLVIFLSLVLIPIQQRLLRYRAERLLSDVRALKLGTATFDQAQAVFQRWERWGDHKSWSDDQEQICTKQSCVFDITLRSPVFSVELFLLRRWQIWRRPLVEEAFALLGGSAAGVRAYFSVQNGIVWGKGITTMVSTWEFIPAENRYYSYDLIAESKAVPRFYAWGPDPWRRHWPTRRSHLEYVIGGPDGCTFCVKVETRFTPYAKPEDIAMLTDINLSCLTRWSPCRTKADILPAAMARDAEDHRHFDEFDKSSWEFRCTPQFAELVSRDSENAAIADVIAVTKNRKSKVVTVRLVERIKRAIEWDLGNKLNINVYDDDWLELNNPALEFRAGERMILLFSSHRDDRPFPLRQVPWLDVCGALSFNESNLALVKQGVLQDDRPQ